MEHSWKFEVLWLVFGTHATRVYVNLPHFGLPPALPLPVLVGYDAVGEITDR